MWSSKSDVLLHHDNAPAHSSHVAMTAIHDCGFELLSHSPYSPDLAPSDFHLFRHLKESLRGRALKTTNPLLWLSMSGLKSAIKISSLKV